MRATLPPRRARLSQPGQRPAASPSFDAVVGVLGLIFAGGLYLDGWAHIHGHVDQSFFTPWHAVLYSGYLVLGGFIGARAIRGRREGLAWKESVPPGYELSLVGGAIFLVGGMADAIWHMLFGVEASVDALFSPTHLVLALGGVLLASGPLRSAWRRRPETTSRPVMPWPAVLSLTAILSVIAFLTQIAHPFVDPIAAGLRPFPRAYAHDQQALGMASVMLQSAIVMGLLLAAVHRLALPRGAQAVIFGLNGLALAVLNHQVAGWRGGLGLVPVALLGGLLADGWYAALRSSALRGRALGLRLYAAGVPVLCYLSYFLSILLTQGIWWSIHLWLGAVAVAGLAGWLLSYVVLPAMGHDDRAAEPAWP